jgi:hypothetical protein
MAVKSTPNNLLWLAGFIAIIASASPVNINCTDSDSIPILAPDGAVLAPGTWSALEASLI